MTVGLGGCIMEEKIIELVLNHDTCEDFEEDSASAIFETVSFIDIADELDGVLSDNDLERSDISRSFVVSVTYGVTDFSHTHDWTISGAVTVRRADVTDGPDTLLNYSNQSVAGALDVMLTAPTNPAGVSIINRAIADYIDGGNPQLEVRVLNGAVTPAPSTSDRIVFDWRVCIDFHIMALMEFEMPDPF
jgi:hypothetical protein